MAWVYRAPWIAAAGTRGLHKVVYSWAAGLFRRVVLSYQNRQVLREIGAMSDHELADIGLRRSDVRDALAVTADVEIGEFLSARVRAYARRTD